MIAYGMINYHYTTRLEDPRPVLVVVHRALVLFSFSENDSHRVTVSSPWTDSTLV